MTMQNSETIRVLWIDEMEFDVSSHKTRLIEMITNLQQDCDARLWTAYRHIRVQPEAFQNEILYHKEINIPGLKRLTRYGAQCVAYRNTLRTYRPNIVLFHCSNVALLRYAKARRKRDNVRLIYDVRTLPVESSTLRNWANGRLQASCLRYAARHFDGITYITDRMRRHCIEEYSLHPHPNAIWTSGVNPELFTPSKAAAASNGLTILYHGYISMQRKIDNVIKAMSLITDIDVRLILLGDGPDVGVLKHLVRRSGLEKQVSFEEPVDYEEVPKWINRCDAGILPFQDWDCWNVSSPIKLFEYMACGKPVIVTNIPAHRDVLGDCEFAFWAKESTPHEIVTAIRRAYQRRKNFKEFEFKSRKLVLDKFAWTQQAKRLKHFLADAISNEVK